MKQTHVSTRLIAILLLVLPGLAATYGFLVIKDALFAFIVHYGKRDHVNPPFDWGSLLGGLALFMMGIGFIGGWTFYRDRKRNYVATRFRKQRPLSASAKIKQTPPM